MADGTKIEWSEATWNPITGCSVHSAGCTNCYAMKLAGTRMKHHWSREGLTTDTKAGPVWNGQVRFNEEWLTQPLQWSKPRMIFVCAHADLFHEAVPDEWIDRIFAVMALCPQHTFQVLTKRAERMRAYVSTPGRHSSILMSASSVGDRTIVVGKGQEHRWPWPLPNVWLGVSVEDQRAADERIPHLLATPAAIRWLSCEPLLGPVDLTNITGAEKSRDYGSPVHGWSAIWRNNGLGRAWLDWIVAGGESGPNARGSTDEVEASMRALLDQCAAARVPFFGKQNFKKLPLPDDLMVREYPA